MKIHYYRYVLLLMSIILYFSPGLRGSAESYEIKILPLNIIENSSGKKSESSASSIQISRLTPEYSDIPKEKLKKSPEEKSEEKQNFQRESGVLLKPGEKEFGFSLSYARNQSLSLYMLNTSRSKSFGIDTSLRMGLTRNMEGFVSAPFVWTKQKIQLLDNTEINNNSAGFGDITAGLKYLLVGERGRLPDIIGSVSLTFPTGSAFDPNDPNMKSGIWQMTSGLTFVKSSDPAVLFASLAYRRGFGSGAQDAFHYGLGLGFAINPQITLSGQFSGAYEMESDEKPFSTEPMYFRAGLSYASRRNEYIEPSITFGLNDDATNTVLNLSYTRRF
jgi:hypothetical protein